MDMRPRGATTPMYNPERDLAHITPTVMHTALAQLDIDNRLPHVRETIAAAGLTEEQIGEAAMKFAEAQRLYVYSGGAIKSPWDAFEASGFAVLPTVLHDLIFAAIGRVLTGTWFYAVRHVTIIGEETPAQQAVAEMLSVGREVARRGGYTDVPAVPQEAELEVLRHRVLALSAMVERQRGVMETQVFRIHELETEAKSRDQHDTAAIADTLS